MSHRNEPCLIYMSYDTYESATHMTLWKKPVTSTQIHIQLLQMWHGASKCDMTCSCVTWRIHTLHDSFICNTSHWRSSILQRLSWCSRCYGVATISRLLKFIGLFCRTSSLLKGSFAKETYNFKEPTTRSHPLHTFIRDVTPSHGTWRVWPMYVCVYTCIYTYTLYVCVYMYIYIYVHVYMYTHICIRAMNFTHSYVPRRIHTWHYSFCCGIAHWHVTRLSDSAICTSLL